MQTKPIPPFKMNRKHTNVPEKIVVGLAGPPGSPGEKGPRGDKGPDGEVTQRFLQVRRAISVVYLNNANPTTNNLVFTGIDYSSGLLFTLESNLFNLPKGTYLFSLSTNFTILRGYTPATVAIRVNNIPGTGLVSNIPVGVLESSINGTFIWEQSSNETVSIPLTLTIDGSVKSIELWSQSVTTVVKIA